MWVVRRGWHYLIYTWYSRSSSPVQFSSSQLTSIQFCSIHFSLDIIRLYRSFSVQVQIPVSSSRLLPEVMVLMPIFWNLATILISRIISVSYVLTEWLVTVVLKKLMVRWAWVIEKTKAWSEEWDLQPSLPVIQKGKEADIDLISL